MVDNRVSRRDSPSASESQDSESLDFISQMLMMDPPESHEEDLVSLDLALLHKPTLVPAADTLLIDPEVPVTLAQLLLQTQLPESSIQLPEPYSHVNEVFLSF
jgi:hypothetical protein